MSRAAEIRLAWAYVAADEAGEAAASVAAVDGGRRALAEAEDRLVPGGGAYLLVPVAAYRALPPRRRPRSFCPVCLERVWLKLGARNRPHYAHLAGSHCAAARGEGALHHAAKVHLAEQLAAGAPVAVRPLCHRVAQERGTERCTAAPVSSWPVRWDEVRVEHALPSLRADLVLLLGGAVAAAVEVYASHAVDDEKAAKYRGLGVPWIEVPARGILPEHGVAWTPDDPLPLLGDSRMHPEVWRCPRHEGLYRGLLEHERNGTHRVARRVVHVYRTDGGRSAAEPRCRAVGLSMVERREEGVPVESWLERDDTGARVGAAVAGADRALTRRRLHARFAEWARWMRGTQGAVVDSPMRWLEAGEAPPAARAYPQRLRWDPHTAAFRGAPGLPALAWPVFAPLPGEPHPVFGRAPCAWTEPHPRKPPLHHALHGPVWLTLAGRAVAAYVHDGARWRPADGAPFLLPAPRQEPFLAALARALSAIAPADLLDGGAIRQAIESGENLS